MNHNITVEGGSSVRLPTAGKYCDRDIVITATGGGGNKTISLKPYDGSEVGYLPFHKMVVASGQTIILTFYLTKKQGYVYDGRNCGLNYYGSVTSSAYPIKDSELNKEVTLTIKIPESGTISFSGFRNDTVSNGELATQESDRLFGKYIMITVVDAGGGGGGEPDPRDQYQRVDYITSAEEGTYPYIITDAYADNQTGVEVVASFPVMQDRIPMGSRQDGNATRFYCAYPLSTSSCYYGFNIGSAISCSTKVNTIYRLQTNFMNSRQAIIYEENGTRKAFATISQTLSTHTAPISVFGYNSASAGTVNSKREYKLYYARLSRGFDVFREYIPCYRKSDGVVGLYETFTKTFLTNDAGVGSFTYGQAIEWE